MCLSDTILSAAVKVSTAAQKPLCCSDIISCLQLCKLCFADMILFCVCSCAKCADSRDRRQHSLGYIHGTVFPLQLYLDVPCHSSDTVLWPECHRPGCSTGVILHSHEPDCHWGWRLKLCQGTDLLPFAHAFKNICLQWHLPSRASAFKGICLQEQLPSGVSALKGTCLHGHLPSGAIAFRGICLQGHLPSRAPAFEGICLQGHLPICWIRLRLTALD